MSRMSQHFFELQQQHSEDDMPTRHAHLPETMAMILNSMCPAPTNDGQQQAQEAPWIPPADHLQIGGYVYEAKLMRDLIAALTWALDQIDDDLDLDHQAALIAAQTTLAKAKGEQA